MHSQHAIPQEPQRHGLGARLLSGLLATLLTLPAPYASAVLLNDSVGSFTIAAKLSRRSSQEEAVKQAASILTTVIGSTNDPLHTYPVPPAFIPGAPGAVPAGGGFLPTNLGAPLSDGYGGKLGYCAWDNDPSPSGGNRITGTADFGAVTFAVVSAGLDGVFSRSCADIKQGINTNNDDFVVSKSSSTIRQGVGGTVYFADPVPTKASLDLLTGMRDGELRLVKDTNAIWRWDSSAIAWSSVSNTYTASNVDITGGRINGTAIGNITPSTGAFTTLTALNATISGGTLNGTAIGASVASSGVFTTLAATGAFSAGGNATFGGNINAMGTVTGGSFVGNGAALSNLNGSAITGGIVAPAFGGTGIDGSGAPAGALLIGNGSGFTLGGLAAGAGIGITTGPGSILIANNGVTSFNARTGAVNLTLADVNGVTNFSSNTTLGSGALSTASTGAGLAAFGAGALANNTSGSYNTAVGIAALNRNTTGLNNTATGQGALQNNTSGNGNTAAGVLAMLGNTTGSDNAAFGLYAMFSATGSSNAAFGFGALSNSTGNANFGGGRDAGTSNRSGSNNTFVGAGANPASDALIFATALGSAANVSTSNTIVLGRTTDKTIIGATGDDGSSYNLQVTGGIKALSGGLRVAGGDLVLNSPTIIAIKLIGVGGQIDAARRSRCRAG